MLRFDVVNLADQPADPEGEQDAHPHRRQVEKAVGDDRRGTGEEIEGDGGCERDPEPGDEEQADARPDRGGDDGGDQRDEPGRRDEEGRVCDRGHDLRRL